MDATSDWITLPNGGYYIMQITDGTSISRVLMVQRNGIELWFGILGPI